MNVFEKIEAQQAKLPEGSAPWTVGEHLKEICTDPRCAELVNADIDNENMGIVQCEKKIKAYSDKHKHGNFGFVPPKVAESIIREFYGLPEVGEKTTPPGIISLDDYL